MPYIAPPAYLPQPSPDTYDWRGIDWYQPSRAMHKWVVPTVWIKHTTKGENMKATHQHILDTIKKALESAEDKERLIDKGEEELKQLYHSLKSADKASLLRLMRAWIKSEPTKS